MRKRQREWVWKGDSEKSDLNYENHEVFQTSIRGVAAQSDASLLLLRLSAAAPLRLLLLLLLL